jgi:hypothetical protein
VLWTLLRALTAVWPIVDVSSRGTSRVWLKIRQYPEEFCFCSSDVRE